MRFFKWFKDEPKIKQDHQWFEDGILKRGTMEEHIDYMTKKFKNELDRNVDENDYDPQTYPREF